MDEFTETASLPTRMLYSTPNNRTAQKLVRSDIGTPSYTRAPGEAPGTFALEVAMDELAYSLKLDPLELRLKNYAERDEDKNLPWSTKSLKECYQQGAARFGWARRNPEPRSMREGNTLIGWGMATSVYPARRSPASARARMYPDGRVLVEAGTQELGGGTYTIMTQIAADALGVPISRVTFRLGDTRLSRDAGIGRVADRGNHGVGGIQSGHGAQIAAGLDGQRGLERSAVDRRGSVHRREPGCEDFFDVFVRRPVRRGPRGCRFG